MPDEPSPANDTEAGSQPTPEVLQPKSEAATNAAVGGAVSSDGGAAAGAGASRTSGIGGAPGKRPKWLKRGTYRPSHKATFIGLAVVAAILVINAVVIGFIIKSQSKSDKSVSQGSVTLSGDALDKVGINRTSVGSSGIQLIVNPNAKFNNKLEVGGEVSIAGQLRLNNKLTAGDASIAKLEAGDTQLSQLNVNGNGTISTLNLRNDLVVVGTSRLQGEVIISKLTTINNNLTVAGNLAVGGTLSVQSFQTSKLVADGGITLGGHIVTRGSAPSVSAGPGVGSNGTVSISGNDAAGTVAVNAGVGASGGIVANVTFRSAYGTTPHVVVTAVGAGVVVYVNRSATGFSIGVGGALSAGGYAFDYIVMQ